MKETKGEIVICVMCMERMGHECRLADLKELHQDAVSKMEEYLANREANDRGPTLMELAIGVEALKGCIKTREDIMGITRAAG